MTDIKWWNGNDEFWCSKVVRFSRERHEIIFSILFRFFFAIVGMLKFKFYSSTQSTEEKVLLCGCRAREMFCFDLAGTDEQTNWVRDKSFGFERDRNYRRRRRDSFTNMTQIESLTKEQLNSLVHDLQLHCKSFSHRLTRCSLKNDSLPTSVWVIARVSNWELNVFPEREEGSINSNNSAWSSLIRSKKNRILHGSSSTFFYSPNKNCLT